MTTLPTESYDCRFDTGARLLETVVLVLENGDAMVIRAKPARKKYLDLLP